MSFSLSFLSNEGMATTFPLKELIKDGNVTSEVLARKAVKATNKSNNRATAILKHAMTVIATGKS